MKSILGSGGTVIKGEFGIVGTADVSLGGMSTAQEPDLPKRSYKVIWFIIGLTTLGAAMATYLLLR